VARKRMIDPRIWESEQVMSLTSDAFKLYIYLINHADDEGRMSVSYPMIKSRCFPINNNSISVKTVEKHIVEMAQKELIWLYEVDEEWYLAHPNWVIYQTINHATPSKLPPLPEDYRSSTVAILPNLIEFKLNEINTSKAARSEKDAHSGEIDQIFDYFRTKTNSQVKSTTQALRSMIHARLEEGYTVEDCKKAIAYCYGSKIDNPDQRQYIRIKTIFAPSNFSGYLDAWTKEME